MEQKTKSCRLFFAFFFICLLFGNQQAQAYSLSYGYLLASTLEREERPKAHSFPPPSRHQLVFTDGYCMFIHQGPFDRICFEGGPGFRLDPFAFDLHVQATLHVIWLRPVMYGLVLNAGLFSTVYPYFQGGLKVSMGMHLYFVTPSIEFQVSVDERGRGDAKIFFQVGLYIPTATVNFSMGNFGL